MYILKKNKTHTRYLELFHNCQRSVAGIFFFFSVAAGEALDLTVKKHLTRTQACVGAGLPLGVLAVNSGSKQNVSSGLPAAGLNGGCSSLLYSFYTSEKKKKKKREGKQIRVA